MKKNYLLSIVLLLFILLFAFLLRSPMFMHGDFYLLPDQGRDLQLVKQIVVDHKLPLIGAHAGIGGLFHGPLWLYMLAPFFLLSHGDPFFTLIPAYLFVGLAIITAGFFIGNYLYNKFVGLVFAFLLATSQIFISTVSFTSNSQVMPLVFLGYLFALVKFLRGRTNYLALAVFFIGLGFHFESAFAVFLIPLTIVSIVFAKNKPSLKICIISVGLFLLTLANFLLFDMRHQFLMTQSVVHLATGHVSQATSEAKYKNLGIRLEDRLSYLWVTVKSVLFADIVVTEIVLGGIFITTVFFVAFSSKAKSLITIIQKERKVFELVFFIGALLFIFVLYMFYPFSLEEHYIQSLNILTILIVSLCLDILRKKNAGLLLGIVFLGSNLLPALQTLKLNYLSGLPYNNTSEGTYLNQRGAVDAVFNDAKGKQFGYFVYDAPIVTYGMDYLMWWRGSTKYGYTPDSQKHPLTYLILLPAPAGDNHAHDFWMKYTVRTKGKVLATTQFKGNITIMKLSISSNEPSADPNYYQNLIFR